MLAAPDAAPPAAQTSHRRATCKTSPASCCSASSRVAPSVPVNPHPARKLLSGRESPWVTLVTGTWRARLGSWLPGPPCYTPSTLSVPRAWLVSFFGEDLIAQIDALVADVHAGTGNELLDLLLALSAKRAGEIGFASLAAALLSGATLTVEFFLHGGDAHAEVAEHTPGTRTRIKRQRGEQVLGADLIDPGPLRELGRPPEHLTGLGRLLWRPPAGQILPLPGTALARRRATRRPALPAAPERQRLPPHGKARSAGDGCPPRRPRQRRPPAWPPPGSPRPVRSTCSSRSAVRAAAGPQSAPWPPAWIPLSAGRSRSRNTPARRASSTNRPISSSAHEASSSLTIRAASTRSSGAAGACWHSASANSAALTVSTSTR